MSVPRGTERVRPRQVDFGASFAVCPTDFNPDEEQANAVRLRSSFNTGMDKEEEKEIGIKGALEDTNATALIEIPSIKPLPVDYYEARLAPRRLATKPPVVRWLQPDPDATATTEYDADSDDERWCETTLAPLLPGRPPAVLLRFLEAAVSLMERQMAAGASVPAAKDGEPPIVRYLKAEEAVLGPAAPAAAPAGRPRGGVAVAAAAAAAAAAVGAEAAGRALFAYWEDKRKRAKIPLVRRFQTPKSHDLAGGGGLLQNRRRRFVHRNDMAALETLSRLRADLEQAQQLIGLGITQKKICLTSIDLQLFSTRTLPAD
jgi:hypothetical protein